MVTQLSSVGTANRITDSDLIGSDVIDDSGLSDRQSHASEQTTNHSSSTSLFSLNSGSTTCSSPRPTSSAYLSPESVSFVSNRPVNFLTSLWNALYGLLQNLLIFLFARPLPEVTTHEPLANPLGRIAIIGAGITGISTAAHFLTNGFEVVIFEQSDSIGGIWAQVNRTSSLQLDSFMYRFHPSVKWSNPFPVKKDEILNQVHKVWTNYRLTSRTRFNVAVDRVNRITDDPSTKWTVNDGADGVFDGVVVAAGTCGTPRRIPFEGRDSFAGKMVHSSELDHVEWEGKRVVVIGGGASAVEALELAVQSGCATPAILVTRTDKWFIPRNLLLGTLFASNPVGVPCFVDRIAERFVRTFHYGSDLKWMSPAPYDGKPAERLYSKTPIVNGEFLKLVRDNRADYVRAKINKISAHGIEIQRFGSRESEAIPADVLVEATGYHRPNLKFLSNENLFSGPKGPAHYAPPNLFLQNFAANDWSCLMTNTGYYEGIGTVGHTHIGILARMMMMFILDRQTAPNTTEMRVWVDRTIEYKGTLSFFTYSELSMWFAGFLLSNPRRWRWSIFVATGWGGVGTRKIKTF